MRDSFSIKENREFHRIYKKGSHKGRKFLVVYALRTGNDNSRLGITVGKKFGNSVQRNHFKRVVRENFREALPQLNGNYDIVVAAKPTERAALPGRKMRASSTPDFSDIRHDFYDALYSLNMISLEKQGGVDDK